MQKWTLINYSMFDGYHYHGKIYMYLADLLKWEEFNDEIRLMKNWISSNNIDALEFKDDFMWVFRNESDRTAFILTWS
jgi:hypothetical protein